MTTVFLLLVTRKKYSIPIPHCMIYCGALAFKLGTYKVLPADMTSV